jgi:phosphoribosylpyrophosphate synthetase
VDLIQVHSKRTSTQFLKASKKQSGSHTQSQLQKIEDMIIVAPLYLYLSTSSHLAQAVALQFWLIKKSHAKDSAKAQRKRARERESESKRVCVCTFCP